MYSLNEQLKDKVAGLNKMLKNKYKSVLGLGRNQLRELISENVGKIKTLDKLDKDHLAIYESKGGIVGVDGSNNKLGGAYPHYVEIYQALAKSTIYKDDPLVLADIYSPLYMEEDEGPSEDEELADKTNIKLSTIEVEAALEAIDRFKPYAILMDGGLIRYNIYANEKWLELKGRCEEEGILLVGVIEDIKTSIIGNELSHIDPNVKEGFYDRELLFGQLDYGEIVMIKDEVNKKEPEGYSSVFLRSSLEPSVIGMDIIESQKQYMEEMARLVFTLTPENSRGIPLWLDIIDREVNISDDIMKALLERYMDRGIYERFFLAERDKRG